MKNQNPKNLIMDLVNQNTPLLRPTEDMPFEEWQQTAREKLCELLGLDLMLDCEHTVEVISTEEHDTYTDIYFRFQSEPNYYAPCHFLKPHNICGKVPVMISLQGHSRGMHIGVGKPINEGDEERIKINDRNYAQMAAQRGHCVIAIEQRYMGECGGTKDGPGCLSTWSREIVNATATLLFGRTAIGERVHDVSTLIDLIENNSENLFGDIDTDNIILTGNSGGGTVTFYTACVDKRIKYAMPSCSVCTFKDSIIDIIHCGCNYIPSIARYFDMCDMAGLIAPRRLIIVAGKDDAIFPIEGVKKTYEFAKTLYQRVGAADKIQLEIGDGAHRYYADKAYGALEAAMKQDNE